MVTILDPPFVMLKDPNLDQSGNLTIEDLEGNLPCMLVASLLAGVTEFPLRLPPTKALILSNKTHPLLFDMSPHILQDAL